jgi:hypothetical protein
MVRTCMRLLSSLLLGLAAAQAVLAADPAMPVLHYDPPPEFRREPFSPPDEYSALNVWPSSSIQFYPFRAFTGDVQQQFRQALLRDWVEGLRREVAPVAPTFRTLQIPGAQTAVAARFSEGTSSMSRQRMRILVVAKGQAALVDVSAGDAGAWQRIEPAVEAVLASLYVEGGAPPPPRHMDARQGAAYRAAAGLYLGSRHRPVQRAGDRGGDPVAAHYYLLSADGRVYRRYDFPPADAGRFANFDFVVAERDDPRNAGRFTLLQGRRMRMEFGGGALVEVIHTEAPQSGRLVVDEVEYFLQ